MAAEKGVGEKRARAEAEGEEEGGDAKRGCYLGPATRIAQEEKMSYFIHIIDGHWGPARHAATLALLVLFKEFGYHVAERSNRGPHFRAGLLAGLGTQGGAGFKDVKDVIEAISEPFLECLPECYRESARALLGWVEFHDQDDAPDDYSDEGDAEADEPIIADWLGHYKKLSIESLNFLQEYCRDQEARDTLWANYAASLVD